MTSHNAGSPAPRVEAEHARCIAEERFRAVFVNAPVGMALVDPAGMIVEANPALARIVGAECDVLVGSTVFSWVHPEDRIESRARFMRLLQGAATVESGEVRVMRPDGTLGWAHSSTSTLPGDDGRPASFIVQLQDVTARRTAEELLKDRASRDQLTGLANRALFTARVQDALEHHHPETGVPAVLFLDLDRFKVINESLGHTCGDQLLTSVAGRFRSCLRPTDVVARLGGDEFAVLLQSVKSPDKAARAARRLLESLAQPFLIDGKEVHVKASVGIALAQPGTDVEVVLRDADAAMYRAKGQGGGNVVIFDANLRASWGQRMELENGLYGALARNEFFLLYQPVVDTATGALTGVEALLRWRRTDGTLVVPADFIPIAEETGLIVPIGTWVIREACRQLKAWRESYPAAPPLSMAVNVSSRQLLNNDVFAAVRSELRGLAPDVLTLEITETAAAQVPEEAVQSLQLLTQRGVRVAVDDFGTGESSLARLRHLPVQLLKIDRQFIANVEVSEGDLSIVRAMIAMAQALGLTAVAEGVETKEQVALLREAGCPLAQGYLYDRPRLPEDLLPKLARRHLTVAADPDAEPPSKSAGKARTAGALSDRPARGVN